MGGHIQGDVVTPVDEKERGGLCLIGCGAQARYALDILSRLGQGGQLSLLDPLGKGPGKVGEHLVAKVSGAAMIATHMEDRGLARFHICLADNALKMSFLEALTGCGFHPATLIHPQAVIASTAAVGEGSLVNPLAVLGPDSRLGRGCLVHSQVNVDHDCVLAECVNLAPGVILAGRVKIGAGAVVYSGAVVAPGVTVGEGAVIGAAACVLEDVPPFTTVAGVPAKVRSTLPPGPAPHPRRGA